MTDQASLTGPTEALELVPSFLTLELHVPALEQHVCTATKSLDCARLRLCAPASPGLEHRTLALLVGSLSAFGWLALGFRPRLSATNPRRLGPRLSATSLTATRSGGIQAPRSWVSGMRWVNDHRPPCYIPLPVPLSFQSYT
jgi:hypothetical protein